MCVKIAAALILLETLIPAANGGPSFAVVAHPSVTLTRISRSLLEDAFLKKKKVWRDGLRIKPVDQKEASAVRESFCEAVMLRSAAQVRSHWLTQIFSGSDTPPPEMSGDEEVLGYVRATPGSIGYVSRGAPTDGVRVLSLALD
jgi:ABC-type phosphate transport system substrate-binding protein